MTNEICLEHEDGIDDDFKEVLAEIDIKLDTILELEISNTKI
jgi:hypothetical protein